MVYSTPRGYRVCMAYLSQLYAAGRRITKKYSVLQERYHENDVAFLLLFINAYVEKSLIDKVG